MQNHTKHVNPKPARAVPPGATIRSELKARGISQVVFANTIERPVQFVSELLNGKRELTTDTARRLEAALDIPASFWLRYESEYRLTKSNLDPELAMRIREKALAW